MQQVCACQFACAFIFLQFIKLVDKELPLEVLAREGGSEKVRRVSQRILVCMDEFRRPRDFLRILRPAAEVLVSIV